MAKLSESVVEEADLEWFERWAYAIADGPLRFSESTDRIRNFARRTPGVLGWAFIVSGVGLLGCEFNGTGSGGWSPAPYRTGIPNAGPRSAPIDIRSEILSATRESDAYSETVNVTVRVVGSGEPLGYFQSSMLDISTGFFTLSAEDTWLNFGDLDSRWPDQYLIRAEYKEYLSAGGSVVITVTIDDISDDRYGMEIYSATHDLVWE